MRAQEHDLNMQACLYTGIQAGLASRYEGHVLSSYSSLYVASFHAGTEGCVLEI